MIAFKHLIRIFKIGYLLFFLSALSGFISAIDAIGCTTFFLEQNGQQVFGKNYDWDVEDSLIIVNKRGMSKRSFTRNDENGEAAAWEAKYGSVTFNQYGCDFPMGGMNETGLVVESMSLSATQYPSPDRRPFIASASLWRQYLLDNFKSIDEVIKSNEDVRIARNADGPGVHLLICDRTGDCATIEFLNGRMVVHAQDRLPIKVLTNDTYSYSLTRSNKGKPPVFDWLRGRSIQRFIRASQMVADCRLIPNESVIDYAFTILNKVSVQRTVWSIVYENINMKIYFKTKSNQKIRSIDMTQLNFSCGQPRQLMDINEKLTGNVTNNFEKYTRAANRKWIGHTFRKTSFLKKIPPDVLDGIARYPDQHKCAKGAVQP